jgi:hypothetical protein
MDHKYPTRSIKRKSCMISANMMLGRKTQQDIHFSSVSAIVDNLRVDLDANQVQVQLAAYSRTEDKRQTKPEHLVRLLAQYHARFLSPTPRVNCLRLHWC